MSFTGRELLRLFCLKTCVRFFIFQKSMVRCGYKEIQENKLTLCVLQKNSREVRLPESSFRMRWMDTDSLSNEV